MDTVTPSGAYGGDPGGHAPVLDPFVLAELEGDVPGAAVRFASDFIGLWEPRRSRLAQAVSTGDTGAALEAVLSVKVSSAMVGALRLSSQAGGLELALRTGAQDVGRLCDRLIACGDETVRAVHALLRPRAEP